MPSPLIILACSSPGAGQAIARSIEIGYWFAGLTVLLVAAHLLLVLRRNGMKWPLWIGVVLLLVHPAWTVSAISGDCGQSKRGLSYSIAILLTVLLVVQLLVIIYCRRGDEGASV